MLWYSGWFPQLWSCGSEIEIAHGIVYFAVVAEEHNLNAAFSIETQKHPEDYVFCISQKLFKKALGHRTTLMLSCLLCLGSTSFLASSVNSPIIILPRVISVIRGKVVDNVLMLNYDNNNIWSEEVEKGSFSFLSDTI